MSPKEMQAIISFWNRFTRLISHKLEIQFFYKYNNLLKVVEK